MRKLAAVVGSICLVSSAATADDYDAVRAALDIGDYDTAYENLAEMGDAGDTLASILLASLALSEADGAANLGLGIAWLEQAAENGSAHAMLQLGIIYWRQGQVIFSDREGMPMAVGIPEAVGWFGRAAETGAGVALAQLGRLYRLGLYSRLPDAISPEEEDRLAGDFLEQAVAAGDGAAMAALAMMTRRDDPERGADLMLSAGRAGDPTAVGILAYQPDRFGITDEIDQLAWLLVAKAAYFIDRSPHTPLFIASGASSSEEFLVSLAQNISGFSASLMPEAQARADAITADWVSYMPGLREGGRGMFGQN